MRKILAALTTSILITLTAVIPAPAAQAACTYCNVGF